MACQLPVEHRLHERTQQQAVVGADEVDGGAHDDDPHHLSLEEQLGERASAGTLEPRPQSRVRVQRHLRLQADEVLDRLEDRHLGAPEQQLALERGPVEGTPAEDVTVHCPDSCHTSM